MYPILPESLTFWAEWVNGILQLSWEILCTGFQASITLLDGSCRNYVVVCCFWAAPGYSILPCTAGSMLVVESCEM